MIIRNINKIKEAPASHEDSQKPGCLKKVIFKKNDFKTGLKPQMINWARIPKGQKFNLHHHQDMVEIFIIIKGHAQITVNNQKKKVSTRDIIMVPEKADHAMENIGQSDVIYYVIGLSKGKGGKTIVKV